MGQYYRAALTKSKVNHFNHTVEHVKVYDTFVKNTLYSNKYESVLAKITEHSWWLNEYVLGIAQKLYNRKGRLMWVGGCSDYKRAVSADGAESKFLKRGYYGISNNNKVEYNGVFTLDNKVIINYSRKEYVNCNKYKERCSSPRYSKFLVANPIPFLTSTNKDYRGEGDYPMYNVGSEYLGRWCYDLISIRDDRVIPQLSRFK